MPRRSEPEEHSEDSAPEDASSAHTWSGASDGGSDDHSSASSTSSSASSSSSSPPPSVRVVRPSPCGPSAAFRQDAQQNLHSLQLEVEQLQQMLMPELNATATPNRSFRERTTAESGRYASPSPRVHTARGDAVSASRIRPHPSAPLVHATPRQTPWTDSIDLSASGSMDTSVLRSVRRMEQARQQRRAHAAAAAAIDHHVDWLDEQPDISLGPAPRRHPSPPPRSVTPPTHLDRHMRARRRSSPRPPSPPPPPFARPNESEREIRSVPRPVPLFLSRSMPASTRTAANARRQSVTADDSLAGSRTPTAASAAVAPAASPSSAGWRRLYSAAQMNGWSLHKPHSSRSGSESKAATATADPGLVALAAGGADALKRSWPFLTRRPERISYEQAARQQSRSSAQPRFRAATSEAEMSNETSAAPRLSQWEPDGRARAGGHGSAGAAGSSFPRRSAAVLPASAADLFLLKLDALAARMDDTKTTKSNCAALRHRTARFDDFQPPPPRRTRTASSSPPPPPSPPLRSPQSSAAPSSPLSVASLVSPSPLLPSPPPSAPAPYRSSSLAFTPPTDLLPAAAAATHLQYSLHISQPAARAASELPHAYSSHPHSPPRRALVASCTGSGFSASRSAHPDALTLTQSYDPDEDDQWSLASESPRHLSFAVPNDGAHASAAWRPSPPRPLSSPSARSFAFDAQASFVSSAAAFGPGASVSFRLASGSGSASSSPMRSRDGSTRHLDHSLQLDVETSRAEDRLRQYQLLLPAQSKS